MLTKRRVATGFAVFQLGLAIYFVATAEYVKGGCLLVVSLITAFQAAVADPAESARWRWSRDA